jgi:glucose-1-phosphatase
MNQNIDIILFDIGNVLVKFDHHVISKNLARYCPYNGLDVYDLIFKNGLVLAYDKGIISSKDFYALLVQKIGLSSDYETFSQLWCEGFCENKAIYNTVRRLSKPYRIGIISDTNRIHFSFMIRNFTVFQLFKRFFLSYKFHSVKAEIAIYSKVLEILDLEAKKVLYVDDRMELIKIANKLGYNTINFTSTARFKKDLQAFEVYLNA